MKIFFFVSALLLFCTTGFSSSNPAGFSECPTLTNLSIVAQIGSSVSFDWDDCGCDFTEYRIYFVRGGQVSPEYSSSVSNISFSGLSPGTYQFYFYTICGSTVSSIIVDEVVIG